MHKLCVTHPFHVGSGGVFNGERRHAQFVGFGAARDFLDLAAITVARGKIHRTINARRVLTQNRVHERQLFKTLAPIQSRQEAKRRDDVANRNRIGGLTALFARSNFAQRRVQLALQPRTNRAKRGFFIEQVRDQSVGEMRRQLRLFFGQLRQKWQQLIGFTVSGAEQAVRPEIGAFAFALAHIGLRHQAAQVFDERQAQHERQSP